MDVGIESSGRRLVLIGILYLLVGKTMLVSGGPTNKCLQVCTVGKVTGLLSSLCHRGSYGCHLCKQVLYLLTVLIKQLAQCDDDGVFRLIVLL